MPITVVTTIKMDRDHGHRIVAKAAPLMKKHGATQVRLGFCYSGARTGTISVVLTYPGWQAYGKAAEAMAEDKAYQALLGEAMKEGEFLDRSIMVMEDL